MGTHEELQHESADAWRTARGGSVIWGSRAALTSASLAANTSAASQMTAVTRTQVRWKEEDIASDEKMMANVEDL